MTGEASGPPARRDAVRRWREGLELLAARDPDIRAALDEVGTPPMRLRPEGFGALLRAIVAQQVSAAAARAIQDRLEAALPGGVEPAAVIALGEAQLRAVGLSRPKASYALSIAEDLVAGRVSLTRLRRLPDEEAIRVLTSLRGIGRWTAEVYLLFGLGRPDIWPAADLALMTALQRTLRLAVRPPAAEAARLAGRWAPHRGAAAILHWHIYRTAPS